MKKLALAITFLLIVIGIQSCEMERFFLLDVTNNTPEEVFLEVDGQQFCRVLPGESKICDDEFEYNRLFHFTAVGINTGKIWSDLFVTGDDFDFYEWVID